MHYEWAVYYDMIGVYVCITTGSFLWVGQQASITSMYVKVQIFMTSHNTPGTAHKYMFFVLWAVVECRDLSSSDEKTVNRNIYYGMLELWWMPQLPKGTQNVVFQHDGVPTHIHNEVTTFLNKQLTSQGESTTWPPHSTDLTPPPLLTSSRGAFWKMRFTSHECL